jgi:hypothetical protein
MKEGTVSILFGIHSPIHSYYVLRAWIKLYHSFPAWWQIVCIFIHDIGHFGKNYLSNYEEKKEHWKLGAELARKLFGNKGFLFVAGHDAHSNYPRSKLYKADKYSWYLAPTWLLYWHTIIEPKIKNGTSRHEAVEYFRARIKKNIEKNEYRPTHSFYLERQNRE